MHEQSVLDGGVQDRSEQPVRLGRRLRARLDPQRLVPGADHRRRELAERAVTEGGEDVESEQALVRLDHPRPKRLTSCCQPRPEPRRCVVLERDGRQVRSHPRPGLQCVCDRREGLVGVGLRRVRADAHALARCRVQDPDAVSPRRQPIHRAGRSSTPGHGSPPPAVDDQGRVGVRAHDTSGNCSCGAAVIGGTSGGAV